MRGDLFVLLFEGFVDFSYSGSSGNHGMCFVVCVSCGFYGSIEGQIMW